MSNWIEEFQTNCLKSYGEEMSAQLDDEIHDLRSACQSPIEELMATGLLYAIRSGAWFGNFNENSFFPDGSDRVFSDMPATEPGISILAQASVGKYRADFLARVAHHDGGYVWGAIECDGHDHHDLTREQAIKDRERDRFFQAQGLLVLRYTGSEIWSAPLKAATGALAILMDRAKCADALRWQVSP